VTVGLSTQFDFQVIHAVLLLSEQPEQMKDKFSDPLDREMDWHG
jgi:hypothetical protein